MSGVALLPPSQENVGSIPARHEFFNNESGETMCYIPDKAMEDAPAGMNAEEACAWLQGYEEGFSKAMDIIAKRDAGIDA